MTWRLWTLHHVLYNGVRRVVFEWLFRVSDDRWLMVIECTGRQVSFWERVKWCCLLSRILPPVLTDERAFHQRQTKQTLRSEKVIYPVKNIDNSLGIIGLLKRVKHLQWKLVLQSYKAKTHYMWHWSTKAVLSRWSIFVAIAKNTLYGSKLYIFILCQKSLGY